MSNWAWYDWVGIILYMGPILVCLMGGALFLIFEALSPFWYLVLKEKRRDRRRRAKQMAMEETRPRRRGSVE